MSPDPWGHPTGRTGVRPGSTHWARSKAPSIAIRPWDLLSPKADNRHLARLTHRQRDRQTDPFPPGRPVIVGTSRQGSSWTSRWVGEVGSG